MRTLEVKQKIKVYIVSEDKKEKQWLFLIENFFQEVSEIVSKQKRRK